MEGVYLRHRDGAPIGPITRVALEVLWDARVVDRTTPVSVDGARFLPVEHHPDLIEHLERVKIRLDDGEDPWPEHVPVRYVAAAEPEGPARDTTTALLLHHALRRARGYVVLPTANGAVRLTYRDGKIVAVDADDPELALPHWLIEQGLAREDQVREAEARAPDLGGDVGGALVAAGVIAPELYFEKLKTWATLTIGRCLLRRFHAPRFEAADVSPPPVPLGFDRYGTLLDALREATSRAILEERLLGYRRCPLIPSQVEGLTAEDLKPKPRELRAFKAVNGVLSLGDLLDELGGSDDRSRDVLRAILFATEAGLVVFGADPEEERERAEAKRLERLHAELADKNLFELFEVTERSSDDDVRQRYTELAKQFHPDGLRPDAAPELRRIRQDLFALVSEGYGQLETSESRYRYALDLDAGRVGGPDEREQIQAALEAETTFKKAEILLRMKKYEEAVAQVEAALALAPDDPEFEVFRAYAVYLEAARNGAGPAAAERAVQTIQGLLKTAPELARGYLYLGHLNKALAKPALATRYFKRVLEYDERNPEALREVRLAEVRKERSSKKRRWGL